MIISAKQTYKTVSMAQSDGRVNERGNEGDSVALLLFPKAGRTYTCSPRIHLPFVHSMLYALLHSSPPCRWHWNTLPRQRDVIAWERLWPQNLSAADSVA